MNYNIAIYYKLFNIDFIVSKNIKTSSGFSKENSAFALICDLFYIYRKSIYMRKSINLLFFLSELLMREKLFS